MPGTIKVLLLAADNDDGTAGLRLDREIREALEAIRMGRAASGLELETKLAVRPDDLHPALAQLHPHVVHFAGHGSREGIILDGGETVGADALVRLFTTFRDVRAVVLNACNTLHVARALSAVVDYTVAMEGTLDDGAAIDFSGAFYAALAFGRTLPLAFEEACAFVRERFGEDHPVPELLVRPGAEAWPLEAPGDAAERSKQVNIADGVEADSAEMLNEAAGTGAVPVSQTNRASESKFNGSLTMSNKLG
ncbi:MAG: CHAT domain-containing protein [Longimicrobiaceae bacterium]